MNQVKGNQRTAKQLIGLKVIQFVAIIGFIVFALLSLLAIVFLMNGPTFGEVFALADRIAACIVLAFTYQQTSRLLRTTD